MDSPAKFRSKLSEIVNRENSTLKKKGWGYSPESVRNNVDSKLNYQGNLLAELSTSKQKRLAIMKLTIIPLRIFAFDGKTYWGQDLFANYFEKLSSFFDELIICALVIRQDLGEHVDHTKYSTPFKSKHKIVFCELPYGEKNQSLISTVKRYIKSAKIIFREMRQWDLVYIFMPGYLGLITYCIAKLFTKTIVTYIAGDWKEVLRYAYPDQNGLAKIVAYVNACLADIAVRMIVKGSIFTLAAGESLYKRYKTSKKTIYKRIPIINMSEEHLFCRPDTCQQNLINCLFVGSLSFGKGITYLLEAIAQLKKEEFNVVLHIVGSGELRESLEINAENLGISESVKFRGYITNGPELFKIYRKCDIFILPTLSEGFPRVLYEAMGQSIPIITTNVGGIPDLMKHRKNALLVPPKSSSAIANSIKELAANKELRQYLIKNGQKIIRQILREDAAKQFVYLLQLHFHHSQLL